MPPLTQNVRIGKFTEARVQTNSFQELAGRRNWDSLLTDMGVFCQELRWSCFGIRLVMIVALHYECRKCHKLIYCKIVNFIM